MTLSDHELIYLYCVTGEAPDLRNLAARVANLYWIAHRDLCAVVSNVPELEFNEQALHQNVNDMEWLKLKVLLHEGVIESVMQHQTVVPFKFATIFRNQNSLTTCLEQNYNPLQTTLLNLKGREEWGVKVYCDRRKLQFALVDEDEPVISLDREIAAATPGKAFFLKKQREDLMRTEAERKLTDYSQDCFERLSEGSLKARLNTCSPGEVTPQKEEMILNAAFLIEALKHSVLMGAIYKLRADYEDKGLRFDCTGPWPPYNFCQFSKESLIKDN